MVLQEKCTDLDIFHEIGHTFGLPDYYDIKAKDGISGRLMRKQYTTIGKMDVFLATGPMIEPGGRKNKVGPTDIYEILNAIKWEK